MKEQRLTFDSNNFLVLQYIEDDKCVLETKVGSSYFSNSVAVQNQNEQTFYYLHLNFDKYEFGGNVWDPLDLDGCQRGLHAIDTYTWGYLGNEDIFPSILPKNLNVKDSLKPRYGIEGYTMALFNLNTDLSNPDNPDPIVQHLYVNYNDYEEQDTLVVKGASLYDWGGNNSYDDEAVKNDEIIFRKSYDFDSKDYISGKALKFVLKPYYESSRIYHKLTCYDYSGDSTVYYQNVDKQYVPLFSDENPNISLVSFIPFKDPSKYTGASHKLKWKLCIFCRGEASDTDWTQVNKINNPARIKCEWRPLKKASNGNEIIISDDEFREKFLHPLSYVAPTEVIPPAEEQLPIDIGTGEFQSVEVDSYNINVYPETGLIIDNRTDDDPTHLLRIDDNNLINPDRFDTYYATREPYYYFKNNSGSKVRTLTQHSQILLDKDGYPLFSLELLKKYGLAFILTDWVDVDSNGLYVWVTPAQIPSAWYSLTHGYDKGEVIGYDIYSTKYLGIFDNDRKVVDAYKLADETSIYDYGDAMLYQPYALQSQMLNTATNIISVGHSRQEIDLIENPNLLISVPGTTEETGTAQPVTLKRTGTANEILTWRKNKLTLSNDITYSYFVRAKIDDSQIPTDLGPRYTNIAYWVNEDGQEYLTTINAGNYKRSVVDWYLLYQDFNNDYRVGDETYGEPIVRILKYIITYTLTFDIYARANNIVYPNIWSNVEHWKAALLKDNHIVVNEVKRDTPYTPEEYLDQELKKYHFMTPMEYYSTDTQLIDDEETSNDWFWLNSIKNWVRYEVFDGDHQTIILKAWNGLGGWDSMLEIVNKVLTKDYYKLIKNYLYNANFFEVAFEYAPYSRTAYVPIIDLQGSTGIMRYGALQLSRETKSLLYKNNMSSHNSKIMFNNETNSYARTNYGLPSDEQARRRGPDKDMTRRYTIGMETHPCHCLVKSANGNLYICYDFIAQTNGPAGFLANMLDATKANTLCRAIFGTGDDKTIEKDWKRYYTLDYSEEVSSTIRNENNETLYGATSIISAQANTKINSISLFANRPNPTTNNRAIQDYLERWNK